MASVSLVPDVLLFCFLAVVPGHPPQLKFARVDRFRTGHMPVAECTSASPVDLEFHSPGSKAHGAVPRRMGTGSRVEGSTTMPRYHGLYIGLIFGFYIL